MSGLIAKVIINNGSDKQNDNFLSIFFVLFPFGVFLSAVLLTILQKIGCISAIETSSIALDLHYLWPLHIN